MQGLAHPDSTVTVTLVGGPGNGTLPPVSTLRWGPGMTAFAAEAVVEMVPQAGWRRVRVDAVRSGAGPTGANLRTVREGWLYFPPAVETLDYDLDGNLISDARWTYGWDGENRLIWMEEKVIPGNGIRPARQRLEFGYDGQSRRVVKRVLVKTSEASEWSLRQERRFLYDGWNMIAELDVPSSGQARLHRSYAWGLDASGTLTGAGGVGGLLLTSHHTPQSGGGTQVTTLAPLYDFNGNVLAYADVDTSTITHRMEYDPFGQELSLDTLLPGEGVAEAPRFRFSTKYTDGETGLVCYGFRYYSPELGRWPSRDPIGEKGGINLYGMVGNDAINTWDYLGLDNPVGPIPPMDRETKQKMFDDWYEGEKKKGNKWNDGLSACPCKIDGTKCPDPDKWENPSDSLHGYHKGASNCMRSKTAGGQPGEQCCYDKNGNLITSGTGAGSADKASPKKMPGIQTVDKDRQLLILWL